MAAAVTIGLVSSGAVSHPVQAAPVGVPVALDVGTPLVFGGLYPSQLDVPTGLTDVTAVSTKFATSLALRSDGTVVAWGENAEGQADVPAGLTDVTAVAASFTASLALRSNGTVVTWAATATCRRTSHQDSPTSRRSLPAGTAPSP